MGSETIPGVVWDDLGFGLLETDFMYVMKCELDADWQKGEVVPYGNLDISPSSAVLNYGQVRPHLAAECREDRV